MIEPLLDQIRKTHAGEPWYGSSRMRLLDGLTAAEAASHPAGSTHSVWQLVLRMTAWTGEVGRRIAGSPARGAARG